MREGGLGRGEKIERGKGVEMKERGVSNRRTEKEAREGGT